MDCPCVYVTVTVRTVCDNVVAEIVVGKAEPSDTVVGAMVVPGN